MTATLPILVGGLLVVSLAAVAGVAAEGEKITICHMPPGDPEGAKTKQVSRSAWHAHEGHGDHAGACTEADRKAHPPASPPPVPKTRLGVSHEGEGELDGDASFKVLVANDGTSLGKGLRLTGTLDGDGRWKLGAGDLPGCAIDKGRLTCEVGDLSAMTGRVVRLQYDGPVGICREVAIDLVLTSTNDATTGDDRARRSVDAGLCDALDPPLAAAGAGDPWSPTASRTASSRVTAGL